LSYTRAAKNTNWGTKVVNGGNWAAVIGNQ